MIGLFPRRDAVQGEVDAFGIVILEPFLPGTPDPLRILVIFVIDRTVDPFHLAVPPWGFLRDEETRQAPALAPGMEIPAELAAIVGLDRGDLEPEIPFRFLDSGRRVPALARREDAEIMELGIRVDDRELVVAHAMFVDILHVELDAFTRLRDHERFCKRRVPAELPLGLPDEALPAVEAEEDGRRDREAEDAGNLELHLQRAVVRLPLPLDDPSDEVRRKLRLCVRFPAPVVVRPVAMVPRVPFVICLLGDAEGAADILDGTLLRFDQAVPAQPEALLVWCLVSHSVHHSEHRHPAPPLELPLGVNCTQH